MVTGTAAFAAAASGTSNNRMGKAVWSWRCLSFSLLFPLSRIAFHGMIDVLPMKYENGAPR